MQFLVIVKATAEYEAGKMPTKDEIATMGAFNQELGKDGMLVECGGLKPSSGGVRMDFSGAKPHVVDGPFAETKELVAGFWLVEASSLEQVVERFKHCPFKRGEHIEIRPFFTLEDFAGIL